MKKKHLLILALSLLVLSACGQTKSEKTNDDEDATVIISSTNDGASDSSQSEESSSSSSEETVVSSKETEASNSETTETTETPQSSVEEVKAPIYPDLYVTWKNGVGDTLSIDADGNIKLNDTTGTVNSGDGLASRSNSTVSYDATIANNPRTI